MGTPDRRVSSRKDDGPIGKTPRAEGRAKFGVRVGNADPNADSWLILETKKQPRSGQCPGCVTLRTWNDAAGELRIPVLPAVIRDDVINTIRNFGDEAGRRRTKDRVIAVKKSGRGLLVTVSVNQLAVRIGKKLDSAFKGGKLEIKYSDHDMPIRAIWQPALKKPTGKRA